MMTFLFGWLSTSSTCQSSAVSIPFILYSSFHTFRCLKYTVTFLWGLSLTNSIITTAEICLLCSVFHLQSSFKSQYLSIGPVVVHCFIPGYLNPNSFHFEKQWYDVSGYLIRIMIWKWNSHCTDETWAMEWSQAIVPTETTSGKDLRKYNFQLRELVLGTRSDFAG